MSEELRPCPFTFITAKTGESIIVDTEDLSFLNPAFEPAGGRYHRQIFQDRRRNDRHLHKN